MTNLFFALCLSVLPLTTQDANVSVSSEKIVLEEKVVCTLTVRNPRNIRYQDGKILVDADLYCDNIKVANITISIALKTNEVEIKDEKGTLYTDPSLVEQALEIASQY